MNWLNYPLLIGLMFVVCYIEGPSCILFSVELESLGPLLGQIIVALSPIISKHPQTVADIFKFLIIENK